MSATGSSPATESGSVANPEFPHVRSFVAELAAGGLRHVCISPGARSTPLTVSFARESRLHCWSHIDERSNGFFALGIAKATRTPTAIVCTSGTAAANFYPAVVEAAHAGVPLIVLTGDRPHELRDCEAGQTIDQIKMYGSYAKWFAEVGMEDCGTDYFRALARRALREAAEVPAGVVHLNFPLREPLISDRQDAPTLATAGTVAPTVVVGSGHPPVDEAVARLAALIESKSRGLIACGPADLTVQAARAISTLAARTGYPIVADPTSQLRQAGYADHTLDSYDALIARSAFADAMVPDFVLRFGGLPVCKPLRLWLERHSVPHIAIDANGRWNDASGTAAEVWRADVERTCNALLERLATGERDDDAWIDRWIEADRQAWREKEKVVGQSRDLSGIGIFARLSRTMPHGSLLYVGNSLPIRQLEAAWPAQSNAVRVLCNRGANGIDGVVSSVLGAAAVTPAPVVGVLGDLSFYHDLNGLLAARRYDIDATLIVPNNDGGGIFSMLPQARLGSLFDEYFTTSHGLEFRHAAALYGCAYERVDDWAAFESALTRAIGHKGTHIIEVPIDRDRDIETTRSVVTLPGASIVAPQF